MGQGVIEEGYEPETIRVFEAVLREGDKVIVCGAHRGYFVSVCSRLVGKTGCVYGFEPEPDNFAELVARCGKMGNVEIFNYALGDKRATAKFYVNSDNDGGHALWDVSLNSSNVKTISDRRITQAEVYTIDSLFADRDMSRLKLLMLDAEGSEHSIVRGAINTIVDNDVPYIICEINNFALEKCQTSQLSLRNYLKMYGFTAYAMNENGVVDIENGEVRAYIPDTKNEVVFNLLFSREGKV